MDQEHGCRSAAPVVLAVEEHIERKLLTPAVLEAL